MRVTLNVKHLLFAVLAALLAFGAVELGLRLLYVAVSDAPAIPDAKLGARPNPGFPGHDRQGFRNPEVPSRADVVALGDSQTYGVNVADDETWPRLVASLTKKTVYNMAYGGYGPVHSLLLWDTAMALQPGIVIGAFYAGNDLYDSYAIVYNRGQLPELRSSDAALRERIRRAEAAETLEAIVARGYYLGAPPASGPAPAPEESAGEFLARHSMIFSVLATAKHQAQRRMASPQANREADWRAAKAFAAARPAYCEIFDDGLRRTVLTPEYRLSALDLADPRIEEGLHIALRVILEMHERAAARKIRFIVLLIPTKETVFGSRPFAGRPAFSALLENEAQLRARMKAFLGRAGIETLDALPALRARLDAGAQPYGVTHDGHPNAEGHRAIAGVVAAALACPQSGANCDP